MASNQLYKQIETMNNNLPEWVHKHQIFTNIIPKRTVTVSERDFRVPAMTDMAGREGFYDSDGGEIGRGQGPRGVVMTLGFKELRLSFELTQREIDATESSKQALKNTLKTVLGDASRQMGHFLDSTFFHDGNPILATATAQATDGGVTRYTLSSTFGARRLRRGQYVVPYSNDGSTARTGARITRIDYAARQVWLSATISGAANDDHLCVDGTSGAISAASGMAGLYFWNENSSTGSPGGLSRATEPEVRSNSVSGAGGLSPILGLNLFHAMLERRGMDSVRGLVGIASLSAHAAAVSNVMNVQNILAIEGQTAEMKDLLPRVALNFPYAGIKHFVTPLANYTRMDWIAPQEWGQASLFPVKWHKLGSQMFFPTYGAGGSPNAVQWFAMVASRQWFCQNPGVNGYISGLPVSSPYA